MNIPSNIILTWKDKNIPNHIIEKWQNLNKNYNILFFTDDDIIDFLDNTYGKLFCEFFSKIPFGRYKADFFRLCYLYKHGGYYVDVDIEPVLSIDSILDIVNKKQKEEQNITFVSVLALMPGHIFQAVLFSTPNHPIIRMCIDSMLFYGSNIGINPKDEYPYIGHPTKCMYENMYWYANSNPKYGLHKSNNECILLGTEKMVENNRVGIFFEDTFFGYSRYMNYDRETGFGL